MIRGFPLEVVRGCGCTGSETADTSSTESTPRPRTLKNALSTQPSYGMRYKPDVHANGMYCLALTDRRGAGGRPSRDSRLEVRLTLTEPMISLRELLTRLQQEAGVPLYAAPDVFTVGEATREYYIYRTAPPAAGKVVVQERRAFP